MRSSTKLGRPGKRAEACPPFSQVPEYLVPTYEVLNERARELAPGRGPAAEQRISGMNGAESPAVRLEQVLDALPAGVVVLDRNGFVQQCNAVAFDLLGSPLLGAKWREVIARAFGPCQSGDDVRLADGRLVAISTSPLGGGPGQIVLLHDVTDARLLQEMVNRQRRLTSLGEMVACLTHQIRTPLASGLLYVAQLERPDLGGAQRRRCLDKIRASLDQLESLVQDMLLFSKGGAAATEQVAVAALIEDLQLQIEPHLAAHGCRLECADESGGGAVRVHRPTLVGALQNLVMNALEACAGRGAVTLTARTVGARGALAAVELLVSDNGSGIPPAVQPRVFEPFFTTKAHGTGLGLAIVQAVVRSYHGAVWLDSAPGQGTTVGVRLPLAAGGAAGARRRKRLKGGRSAP